MNDFKARLIRTFLLCVLALLIGAGIAYYQVTQDAASVQSKGSKPIDVAGISIGGAFDLIDHNGKAVSEADYEGMYKLVYFGFTYCPAICPTELQKISATLNSLPPRVAEKIQPLFVSVDPERDTPEVMHAYVDLFHPRMVGLTGSRAQIDKVLADYKVYARKVVDERMSDYTMDHSSFIYFLNQNNEMVSIYRIKDSADFISQDIQSRLGNG